MRRRRVPLWFAQLATSSSLSDTYPNDAVQNTFFSLFPENGEDGEDSSIPTAMLGSGPQVQGHLTSIVKARTVESRLRLRIFCHLGCCQAE